MSKLFSPASGSLRPHTSNPLVAIETSQSSVSLRNPVSRSGPKVTGVVTECFAKISRKIGRAAAVAPMKVGIVAER